MTAPARRYEWQSLLDVIGCDDQTVKARLGLDHRQVARYRSEGLTERRADELATAAGWPTLLVWPDMAADALEDVSVACEECGETFIPSRKGHTFCTERCWQRMYKRERHRRLYATDPEFRAQKLAAARRYREGAKRALGMKQRQWKQENADRLREYRRRYYQENRERLLAKQAEYDARRREKRNEAA
ncbi:MAG: hypothetical protein ACOY9J_07610 [Pseudomonadota bacterium]